MPPATHRARPVSFVSIALVGVLGLGAALAASAAATLAQGFAVVELFTSEGCSSCPPAEELASNLARGGPPVHVLVFHVDYWDKLGWPDRFASPAYSDRQRAYVASLKAKNLYTPQMVVNGQTEFVGSKSERADEAIEKALASGADASLKIERVSVGEAIGAEAAPAITASVRHADLPEGTLLCIALVENGLTTTVTAGENEGKTLRHDRVVRAFSTSAPDADGATDLGVMRPRDAKIPNCVLVVFAQEGAAGRIVAVDERRLVK